LLALVIKVGKLDRYMSLTKSDLSAIAELLNSQLSSIKQDVHELYATTRRIEVTVDSIERVQMAELERNDKQDIAIKKIRKALHAA